MLVALLAAVSTARAQEQDQYATGLQVDVWTDRGNDAVYQPGDTMLVQVHVSNDAQLLVYEVDAGQSPLVVLRDIIDRMAVLQHRDKGLRTQDSGLRA